MSFFPISNDCELWSRHMGQSCKRLKIQNNHLSPETSAVVMEVLNSNQSESSFDIMDAELNKPHLHFLTRQLLCDLYTFIKHAKQLFNDRYNSLQPQSPIDRATAPTTKQMDFLSHAIIAYLNHFALSDAILELLGTSAQIFKNPFQQTAASMKEYFHPFTKTLSATIANGHYVISPTSWTADSFSKMTLTIET